MVPVFEGPSGDPEEQRDIVRLVVRDREVGMPVLVEIGDGQVHRTLAGRTGPRHFRSDRHRGSQREDVLAAGNHKVQPSVAIQIASLDCDGRASDSGAEAVEVRRGNPREVREIAWRTATSERTCSAVRPGWFRDRKKA